MTKDPGFGVSQFMENARYQHALETELARTIASLQNVQGARVHLAVPQQSAFVRDRRPGSALGVPAVEGRASARRRAGAGHRESGGLEHSGAAAAQVTVVDQAGPPAVRARQRQRDRRCATRCSSSRIARRRLFAAHPGTADAAGGPGPRARAGGGADRHVHHRSRRANSTTRTARSCAARQTTEEAARNGAGTQGVPGALTNQPPQPGVALPPGATPAGGAVRRRPRRRSRRRA